MASTHPLVPTQEGAGGLAGRRLLGLSAPTAALWAILLLAAALRLANLSALGNGNEYYTAGVKSMLQSWHNFFFVAAEPGGSVTIDKPPLGLWLQALSAFFLGVSGVAVALPQILAGIGSVALLYHLVRRWFGQATGLLAALVLAVTPVAIAAERNNTMDTTLVFTLLLAAWAFIRASETGLRRFVLLGAALVGLGFNIKMMQAFLPLPAFYALYLFGAQAPLRRKLADLALASALIAAVALAWPLAVDLTPADQRPYIGSSTNNTVMELIVGHNGLNRLLGGQGRGGPPSGAGQGARPNLPPPPPGAGAGQPGGQPGGPGGQGGPGGGPGGEVGQPGALRLFSAPLGNEVGWLLPLGLLTCAGLAAGLRRAPPGNPQRALILWGGWLLTCVVFFSAASFFHAYYMVMLAAPLAALAAVGVSQLWQLRASRPGLAALLLVGAAAVTVGFQIALASQYGVRSVWLAAAPALALVGAERLLAARTQADRRAGLGLGLLLAAVLCIPAAWSALTTFDPSPDINLPHAYAGTRESGGPPQPRGGQPAGQSRANPELLRYLQANTQDTEYMLVVSGSGAGAPYVLATGRPVLYAGGFNGGDPVIDADGLARMAAEGRVRYVLWGNDGPGPRASTQQEITRYLQAHATVVDLGPVSNGRDQREPLTLYRIDR
jgi:4-amino-4-deoxy-L-arabinose transferase-like glycosyltransferase